MEAWDGGKTHSQSWDFFFCEMVVRERMKWCGETGVESVRGIRVKNLFVDLRTRCGCVMREIKVL
jgi:hypothetical protein